MRLALLAVLLLLGSGCDTAADGPSDPSAATHVFDVTFLDTSDAEVSRATLTFAVPAPGVVAEGSYRHVSGRPVATSEVLRATAEAGGPVRVALDPGIADGGTELIGPFSQGTTQGAWSSGSFAGPVPRGTFRAERQ